MKRILKLVLWFMFYYKVIITICALIELLKSLYIFYTSRCSVSEKRPRAQVVGILDLIFAFSGLTLIALPIIIIADNSRNNPTSTALSRESDGILFLEVAIPLLILSITPTLTGITTLIAIACKNRCSSILAIAVRLISIIFWVGTIIAFLFTSVNYQEDNDQHSLTTFLYLYVFLGVPLIFGFTQVYFIYILCKFRSDELSELGNSLPCSEMEFQPLTT